MARKVEGKKCNCGLPARFWIKSLATGEQGYCCDRCERIIGDQNLEILKARDGQELAEVMSRKG